MANRRMISNAVVKSARFLRMPPTSQNLYFHLILNADDDGIVEAFPVMRMIGAVEDDLKILMEKKFIEVLNEDLVTYVYDWLEHNKIRADRKVDSVYKGLLFNVLPEVDYREVTPKKKSKNSLKDNPDPVGQTSDNRQTIDRKMSAQDRLGKDRLGKDSVVQDSVAEVKLAPTADMLPIFDFWEQNGFGPLPPVTMEKLAEWIGNFIEIGATNIEAKEIILYALEISLNNGVRKYSYTRSILQDWLSNGFKTVQQIKAEDVKKRKQPDTKKLKYEMDDDYANFDW